MFTLPDLDERTRRYMLEEIERDANQGTLYISPRLSNTGAANYPVLLREAAQLHEPAWLAHELNQLNRMQRSEQRRLSGGGFATVAVPETAAQTLAEGEFNRFYARAICRRAIDDGVEKVVIFRAREVHHPRFESQQLVGKSVDALPLLSDLRQNPGMETALGVAGANSGLSVRLPGTPEPAAASDYEQAPATSLSRD